MPQQQALQAGVFLLPLVVSRFLSCGCGCGCGPIHGRNGELFLIIVFYPTLLTAKMFRPSPHQRRSSRIVPRDSGILVVPRGDVLVLRTLSPMQQQQDAGPVVP